MTSEERKEKQRVRSRRWYEKNKKIAIARAKEWKKENPDKVKVCNKNYRMKNEKSYKERDKKWAKENPEKIRARSKRHYKLHSEKLKLRSAEYRKAHPEKIKAQRLKYDQTHKEEIALWAKANPEKIRASCAAWRKAHPETVRINSHNRRAKEKSAGGKISHGITQKLLKFQKNKCVACKAVLSTKGHHLDHIVPISKGGKNIDANIQLLCPACNHKKSAKDPIKFMQEMGYLL